ncbi:hypothetical protein [Mammaliicoccus vitulinus]|uniref:DoxX family protein n=1 Tax=Mammaliicoccus vitulinus TaxID=71237 RepID=UPI003B9E6D8D
MKWVRRIFGIGFTFAGVMHFVRSEGFEAIVPSYLPFKKAIIWITGVMEIIFGLLLILKNPSERTKKLIEWFLVAVFPANVYMAQKNIPLNGKVLPKWALWGRLPLQYVLIKLVRKM